jgi:uncharacterized membrane protein
MIMFVVQPTQAAWRAVFLIASGVYIVCAGFYLVFSSGVRQAWDNPDNDVQTNGKSKCDVEKDGMMLQTTNH